MALLLCSAAHSQQIPCPVTNSLTISNLASNNSNPCEVQAGSSVATAPGATFTNTPGALLINDFGASLINDGTLINNGGITNNGSLTSGGAIDNNAGASLTVTGTGILTLTGNGSLGNGGGIFNGGSFVVNGTLTNNGGGALTIGSGGSLGLGGAIFNNGTLTTSTGGSLTLNGNGSLSNGGSLAIDGTLTNNGGTLATTFGGSLALGGAIFNNGTLTTSTGGSLTLNGNGSLSNGGSLAIDGTLTNNGGTLATTFGGSLALGGAIYNSGSLATDTGASLTVLGTGTLNNSGSLTNAGVLTIQGTLNNAAGSNFVQTAGQLILSGNGVINSFPAVQIQGGGLLGDGSITGNVNNTGGNVEPTFLPGAPPALTINGSYAQGSGGTLIIDLGGTGGGQFGALDVSGGVTLDGTVDFTAVNGFTPGTGDAFTFLLFGSLAGDFAKVDFTNWTCPVGDACTEIAGANGLTLEIAPAAPTPEPSTLLLLGTGIFALGRHFKKKARART